MIAALCRSWNGIAIYVMLLSLALWVTSEYYGDRVDRLLWRGLALQQQFYDGHGQHGAYQL